VDLTLRRLQYRQDGIFSELLKDDGEQFCVTIEHAYPQNGHGFQPKLPDGVYVCERGEHRLEGMYKPFITFEIMNVPGHTGILFHVGNFNNDSNGCVCVGEMIGQNPNENGAQIIFNSQRTFDKFIALQEGLNSFVLTVD
jgi:hypothetical protein